VARRTRDFAAPCFVLRDGVRRPLALPRDFVDRARRALLVLRALLLPALLAAERRAGLRFFLDAAGFLRRGAGRGRLPLERAGRGKPIAFLAVSAIGSPVAADLPAMAPITPPTTAPTGPATLPRTAPAAAPAAGLEIGGTVMFSLDCDCSLDVEFSVLSFAISSPGFNA
jgi:hypothetical protein